jgi:hypothetical protein
MKDLVPLLEQIVRAGKALAAAKNTIFSLGFLSKFPTKRNREF